MANQEKSRLQGCEVLVLVFLVFGMGVIVLGRLNGTPPAGAPPAASVAAATNAPPRPTDLPPNAIGISIVTNDTKADWLRAVTEPFNKSGAKTSAGHDIIVEIVQEASPEPTVRKIVAGELQAALWSPADISWIEQANRLLKEQGKPAVVTKECPRIVYAATGFAMWRPMAEALGWPDTPIGWKEITALAADPDGWADYGHPEWGQFKFGHTHPAQSSTGFNILGSLAYAAAGKTAGLTPEDVRSEAVMEAFRRLESDTYHYGTSTRRLLTVMAERGPSYLHAAAASETSMLATQKYQKEILRFPLAFIFPAEGVFWMDNPACVLEGSWVSAEQREAAETYLKYLLAAEQQDKAIELGLRPAVASVPLHTPISLDNGTDPRVSMKTITPLASVSAETQAVIINAFIETKKKATVVLVLDRSGSMEGVKLENATKATSNFISRLAPADEVHFYHFSTDLAYAGPNRGHDRDRVRAELSRAWARGYTALNDALCAGVATAERARKEDSAAGEQRLYGVVLLTDGQENSSTQKDVFSCLPTGEDVEGVKVFTIAYGGDADKELLKKIAERTNGKTYVGDPNTIEQVYLDISSEQ